MKQLIALSASLLCAVASAQAQDAVAPAETGGAAAEAAPVESIPVDPASARAATNPAPEDSAGSGSRLLEEIVVTAQKREENLLDVPVSVQAFSADTLDARGISDQAGLMRSTPSLDVATQTGFTTLFLRGVGTDAFLTADPSIASYIDGVYFPFTPSIVQDFGAIERVEVLKGPQGTLFGRNAIGGAINTITTKPDFEESAVSFQSGYSSNDTWKNRVYVNVPISDNMAANASVLYSSGDSYLDEDSSVNGRPLYRETHKGARGKLRWAPIEALDFGFSGTYLEDNDNASLPSNFYVSPMARNLMVPPAEGRRVQVDQPLYRHFKSYVVAGEATAHLPWLDIKGLVSDQRHEQDYIYDFDGSARPYVSFAIGPGGDNGGLFADIQEAELQFISNSDSPGADWLTFTAGVFYFKGRSGLDPIRATVSNLTAGSLSSFGVSSQLLDAINAIPLPPGLTLPSQGGAPLYSILSEEYTDTDSLSEYVQVTLTFTDWIALTLGGRYQDEERSVPKSVSSFELQDGTVFTPPTFDYKTGRDQNGATIPLKNTTKGFKPKVTLDLHPFSDDTLIFLTYQEAVKSATYNSYAIYLAPEFVEAEEIEAYEVGVKTRLFDNSMQFSTGAWRYDIKNPQVQFVSLIQGGAVSFENAQKARSEGIDFDLVTAIVPSVVDDLALTLNGAYVKARFIEYTNGSGLIREKDDPVAGGTFNGTNDYSGKKGVRTPKYSGSATLLKTWGTPGGDLETSVDYYYNDGFFYTASNDPNLDQKSYGLVGARVSYLYDRWQLRATLFGSNLADKLYTTGNIAQDFGGNFTVAPGRVVGLRLDWDF